MADARNDPAWCPKVSSCEQTAGDGPAPGARYLARHRPTRLKPAADIEIELLDSEPPHRVAWREEDGDGVYEVTYELEPADGGTRFTQRSHITWKLPRPLQLVADRMPPRHLEEQMAELKRVLEET